MVRQGHAFMCRVVCSPPPLQAFGLGPETPFPGCERHHFNLPLWLVCLCVFVRVSVSVGVVWVRLGCCSHMHVRTCRRFDGFELVVGASFESGV